jgi:excisionase family DNA binding protein
VAPANSPRGFTIPEVARLLRCRPSRIRAWVREGRLPAHDTGTPARGRLVVLPRDLDDFLAALRQPAAPPPKARRRKPTRDYLAHLD